MGSVRGKKVVPLWDQVLILIDTADEKSPGGIVLPDDAKEKPTRGRVIASGPGRHVDGVFVETRLKVDQTVLFPRYEGTEIRIDGHDHLLMREGNVLALLE